MKETIDRIHDEIKKEKFSIKVSLIRVLTKSAKVYNTLQLCFILRYIEYFWLKHWENSLSSGNHLNGKMASCDLTSEPALPTKKDINIFIGNEEIDIKKKLIFTIAMKVWR
jgi:hypothetical protein